MSLKSHSQDSQPKVPPGGLVLRIFTPEKIHRPQSGLNMRTLVLEASTLPRDHRDLLPQITLVIYANDLVMVLGESGRQPEQKGAGFSMSYREWALRHKLFISTVKMS